MPKFIYFNELEGRTVESITVYDEFAIEYVFTDGSRVVQFHVQECCERVWFNDVDGDLNRLVGQVIIQAEERHVPDPRWVMYFYTIRTELDSVTMRWYGDGGESGYYGAQAWTYELEEGETAVEVAENNAGM